MREAIFIASPSLYRRAFTDGRASSDASVRAALTRYLHRMAMRPTPFGLFAGCSLGMLGDRTQLRLKPRSQYRRYTQLDMHFLCELTDRLAAQRPTRERLRYQPNTSLYPLAGAYRYISWHPDPESKARCYEIVAVQRDAYLDRVLSQARCGAMVAELASSLVDDEIDFEEARAFVHELIDAQLLVSDLEPPLTASAPLAELADRLPSSEQRGAIRSMQAFIASVDAAPLGSDPVAYQVAARKLEALPCSVDISKLFQVDLYKPAAGLTVGQRELKAVEHAVGLLQKLCPQPTRDPLSEFRERFTARYEQREVPLCEALDEEHGIGFGGHEEPSPLLGALSLPVKLVEPGFSARDHKLLELLLFATRADRQEIVLSDRDVEQLSASRPVALPRAFAAIVTLSTDEQAVANEEAIGDIYLHGLGGPSGARLLGRFCHTNASLRAATEHHLRQEEALEPDAVFAEIVHLPQGRLGNVIRRPAMRRHEIPFLAGSGVDPSCRLPLSDLMLRVDGDSVLLRSRSMSRRVIVCLTSALIAQPADAGIFRFLCALMQHGSGTGFAFSWGCLEGATFLPRIRKGRVVLSLAQWRLSKRELGRLKDSALDTRPRAVAELREARTLPRWVSWVQGDKLLPVDWEDAESVDAFLSVAASKAEVVVRELFPAPGHHVVSGPEGRYASEIIVPFVRTSPEAPREVRPRAGELSASSKGRGAAERARQGPDSTGAAKPSHQRATPQRTLIPGDGCLYLKLYCGPASADHLLQDLVAPIVEWASASGSIRQWFFIRYADPDFHLRLRFLGDAAPLWNELWPRLQKDMMPWLEQQAIRKVQLDTYEREIERYGGGVTPCEALFQADSAAVLSMLPALRGDGAQNLRWRVALLGSDRLLSDLGLTLAQKKSVADAMRQTWAQEHNVDATVKKQLGKLFRRERPLLERLLSADGLGGGLLGAAAAAMQRRSAASAEALADLRQLADDRELTVPIEQIASNLVHMHNNRVHRHQARTFEMVIYDFLARLYTSRAARGTKTIP